MKKPVSKLEVVWEYEESADTQERLSAAFQMLFADTLSTKRPHGVVDGPFDKNSVSNIMRHDSVG
jgi:hypothetical protein